MKKILLVTITIFSIIGIRVTAIANNISQNKFLPADIEVKSVIKDTGLTFIKEPIFQIKNSENINNTKIYEYFVTNNSNAVYLLYTDKRNLKNLKIKDIYNLYKEKTNPIKSLYNGVFATVVLCVLHPIYIPLIIVISPGLVVVVSISELTGSLETNKDFKKELKSKYNMNTVVYSRDANTGIEIPPNSTAVIYSFNHHIYLYNTETQIMYIYAGNGLQEYNKQEHKKYAPPYIPKNKQQKVD